MNFELTDLQRELRDEVRTIAQEEFKPRAIELARREAYPAVRFGLWESDFKHLNRHLTESFNDSSDLLHNEP